MTRGTKWCMDAVLVFTILSMGHAKNTTTRIRCEDARLKCAYRTGCGTALQHYLTGCNHVLDEGANYCPESCQHALIALMSSDEGKALMTCDCAHNYMCLKSKQRVEICRSSVTEIMNSPRVSCKIATWICDADGLCSTALHYYNQLCKRMFHGKKCSHKCLNSISILKRQEKAQRLNNCICDGTEEYNCKAIYRNMEVMCFRKNPDYNTTKKIVDKSLLNEININRADGIPNLIDGTMLATNILLLLFTR